jgi:Fe2+ or Zn2+ uptake regulation protein
MKKTRMTTQRIKILDYLKSVHSHPTAEEIHREVKKILPAITLATVYRNLNLLADKGTILKIKINNEYRFDADTSSHQHCLCKKCGKLTDLHQEKISKDVLKKVRCKHFKPSSVTIILEGTCKDCV